MIIVFGSITLDFIVPTPRLPEPGERLLVREGRVQPGGKGANQAVAAARDGARAAMIGAVGTDGLAEPALAGLRSAVVDVSRVARRHAPTGCAATLTHADGARRVAVAANANLLASAAQVEDALLTPESLLLLQMETDPVENGVLVLRARRRGARVMLNFSPPGVMAAEALRAVDYLVLAEEEAAWLGQRVATGGNAASLHAALGVGVVCSRATEGVEAVIQAGHWQLSAHNVHLVDTAGAGDVLAGVLGACLDKGMAMGPALERANAAAALSCTRAFTQENAPAAEEIDAMLREAKHAKLF